MTQIAGAARIGKNERSPPHHPRIRRHPHSLSMMEILFDKTAAVPYFHLWLSPIRFFPG